MSLYLSNAFALSMIADVVASAPATLKVTEVSVEDIKVLLQQPFTSAVGHVSTTEVLKSLLDTEIPCNRVSIKLAKNDTLIVFQLLVRIEEGKILSREEILKLPFKFYLVEVL